MIDARSGLGWGKGYFFLPFLPLSFLPFFFAMSPSFRVRVAYGTNDSDALPVDKADLAARRP